MAFGFKTVGNAINPSAVGVQNKKPQVYGLAKLSELDPVACAEKRDKFLDLYTAVFGAGGAAIGAMTDNWEYAFSAAFMGALLRNYADASCLGPINVIFDIGVAMAGFSIVRTFKDRK
jgi:hypothetical protein